MPCPLGRVGWAHHSARDGSGEHWRAPTCAVELEPPQSHGGPCGKCCDCHRAPSAGSSSTTGGRESMHWEPGATRRRGRVCVYGWVGGVAQPEGECQMDAERLGCHEPLPKEKQKQWCENSGLCPFLLTTVDRPAPRTAIAVGRFLLQRGSCSGDGRVEERGHPCF